MKKAVITILGTIGGKFNQKTKQFEFEKNTSKSKYESEVINLKKNMYINTLPLLIDSFKNYEIVLIYTQDAKKIQKRVLIELEDKKEFLNVFDNGYEIKDENDFGEIFAIFEEIFKKYDSFIIDVTHGFRHLPLLLLIELLIKNFQDTSKIEKILFAKEIVKPLQENSFSGEYEIINLKDYLDLANVAFILETFAKNYTLTSHIKVGDKFRDLEKALKSFSEDILVLNTKHLFRVSSQKLIKELEDLLKDEKNISIKNQVENLIIHLQKVFKYQNQHRFYTYYKLAEDLKDKGYLLNSLALLYESVRLFLEFYLKSKYPKIMEKVREGYKNDDYKVGDFCMNVVFNAYNEERINKNRERVEKIGVSFEDYKKLINSLNLFRRKIYCNFTQNYLPLFVCISKARNNFAHAKEDNNYEKIQIEIDNLFNKYFNIIEKYKGIKCN